MMLLRYLSQIGKYFLMWKEIFNKPTKWSVMRTLIFKEIDDLIRLLQQNEKIKKLQ